MRLRNLLRPVVVEHPDAQVICTIISPQLHEVTVIRYASLICLLVLSCLGVTAQTAKLQVIHNAADPAAAVVDVYANGVKLLDDFAFRTASPYVDVPAGVDITVAIALPNSVTAEGALFTKTVNLPSGGVFVAVANGVLNPGNFAPNSDALAKPIAFDIYPAPGRTKASVDGTVDLFAFHGSTDAPRVDVIAGGAPVVSGLSYGEASEYLTVPPAVYDLGIAPAGGNAILTFRADLTDLGSAALIVVASGFFDPMQNANGPVFGLYAVPPSGGAFIELPVVPTQQFAKVQVIHNAADPAAAVVDVWAGNEKLADDFAFRTATQFVEVPAGIDIPLGIALSNSTSASEALATFTVNLAPGRYVVVANGVLNPSEFAANTDPEAAPISFNLYSIPDILPRSSSEGNVDFIVFHGASDAPKVDVLAGETRLIENLSYGKASSYVSVPAASYVIGVAPAGGSPIALFEANVTALAGNAITVVASGFLNPEANKNGAAFGLFAALPAGGNLIALPPASTSVQERPLVVTNAAVWPNPSNGEITLSYALASDSHVRASVVDVTGRTVMSVDLGNQNAGDRRFVLQAAGVPAGMYSVVIAAGAGSNAIPVSIVR